MNAIAESLLSSKPITESGYDSNWDTGSKLKVDFGGGRSKEIPIWCSAGRDTPAEFWVNVYVCVDDLTGVESQFRDIIELGARVKTLSNRDVNSGYTVRDMDDSDVFDRCNGEAIIGRWAGKMVPMKRLSRMYAQQNSGEALPAIQQDLGIGESVEHLINRVKRAIA